MPQREKKLSKTEHQQVIEQSNDEDLELVRRILAQHPIQWSQECRRANYPSVHEQVPIQLRTIREYQGADHRGDRRSIRRTLRLALTIVVWSRAEDPPTSQSTAKRRRC